MGTYALSVRALDELLGKEKGNVMPFLLFGERTIALVMVLSHHGCCYELPRERLPVTLAWEYLTLSLSLPVRR